MVYKNINSIKKMNDAEYPEEFVTDERNCVQRSRCMQGSQTFKKLAENTIFQNIMLLVIVLCSISMGLATSSTIKSKTGNLFRILDIIFVVIFIIEAFIKIIACSVHYFLDIWNLFDLFIIIVSVIPSTTTIYSLRALRVLRAFRTFKIAERVPKLKAIINSILFSSISIVWVFMIILVIFYMYALIGIGYFGDKFPDKFGTIPIALYSLFVVMTLEGLSSQYARPISVVFPGCELYFVSFAVIVSYLLMNVIVGLICEALQRSTDIENKEIAHRKLVEESKKMKYSDYEKMFIEELSRVRTTLTSLKDAHIKIMNIK